MSLAQPVVDAVANANFKNLSEGASFYLNLAMADAVAHQRSVNAVREAVLSSALKGLVEIDPTQAMSQLKLISGNDLGAQITQLLASLASNQQQTKVAQTTPPETGK